MRVIYETTTDCNKCPYNRDRVCLKLGKFLFDICFEMDCPLPFLSDMENEQQSKIKELEELREEDKRLNQVIINLHDDIRKYKQKVQKQHMIINIQWDIIACLMELKGVIDDE